MSAKPLFSAVVLCAAVLACGSQPFSDGRTLRCTGQSCDVQVAVACSSGVCTASIDNDTVQVPHGNSPNIIWQLQSPGYTFPSNGIVIANAGTEFDNCQIEANGRRFKCHDKHTRAGRYKYTVNITGSPAVPPLDPFVDNQ
jgi:hypothetical protein